MKHVKSAALVAGAVALLCTGCQQQKPADPNAPQSASMTMALVQGDAGRVKALLDSGESVEAKQEDRTPLCVAAMNGHVNVIEMLVARGANVNYKDSKGQTPLMYATESGSVDAVKALLSHGAQLEARTSLGETALMGAVGHGYVDIAKFLVEKGANINAKTNNGRDIFIMGWERYNGAAPKASDTVLYKWLKSKAKGNPTDAKRLDSASRAEAAMVKAVETKTGGPSKN